MDDNQTAIVSTRGGSPGSPASGEQITPEERAEMQRQSFRRQMNAVDVSDVEDDLKAEASMQRTRKMSPEAAARVAAEEPHIPKTVRQDQQNEQQAVSTEVVSCVEVVENSDPFHDEIQKIADRTPEVRFTKAHMLRPFNDAELKLIAAALRTGVALYRVADTLHCSTKKIENAIQSIPVLTELAKEKIARRREQAQEAVDDCVKARVPAVVMWNAEKLLPEIYGNQVNIDNEDDTKLVIGAIPEEDLVDADAAVALANSSVPEVGIGAVMEAMQEERGAELAAAGGGVPVSPLQSVPPAPALDPPAGDKRFSPFVPASKMGRVDDLGPDNYGAVGGGSFDDFDDGSWI